MRPWIILGLVAWLAADAASQAATGKVKKVLPQFLDDQGRASVSPSLYDRDAYQAILNQHPEKRSGLQFQVHWRTKGPVWEPLTLRVELRGAAPGKLPKQRLLDQRVTPDGWFGHWSRIELVGAEYKEFGEVRAWRVTVWEGQQQIGEQRSLLW